MKLAALKRYLPGPRWAVISVPYVWLLLFFALLLGAVRSLSVADAVRIVRGGDTAVTDYFQRRTREPLGTRFLPIVTRQTQKVALAEKYNAVAAKAGSLGLVSREDSHIEGYVTRKALDGLYGMIGDEEKKIRQDPVGSGSDLLRRVFGG